MKSLKSKIWLQLVVVYTRFLLGGSFVFASVIKIKGTRFTTESGEFNPIDNAWHLFETLYQSGLYWKFIGVCQLVAGLLIMTQRFSKLGAVIYLPIILNIFIITISYYFAYTPVITGMMLLSTLFLIAWDWNVLKVLLSFNPQIDQIGLLEGDRLWEVTGVLLFLFTFGYRMFIDKYHLGFWFLTCLAIGTLAFIFGVVRYLRRDKIQKHKKLKHQA